MSVRLRIERIVLEGYGFGPRERGRFEASFSAELALLLGAGEVGARGSVAMPAAVAPSVGTGVSEPGALGEAVARSVYSGLPR